MIEIRARRSEIENSVFVTQLSHCILCLFLSNKLKLLENFLLILIDPSNIFHEYINFVFRIFKDLIIIFIKILEI